MVGLMVTSMNTLAGVYSMIGKLLCKLGIHNFEAQSGKYFIGFLRCIAEEQCLRCSKKRCSLSTKRSTVQISSDTFERMMLND